MPMPMLSRTTCTSSTEVVGLFSIYVGPVTMFSTLKKVLKGCRIGLDKDVKIMVVQWFHQARWFSAEGIHKLVHQCDAHSPPTGTIFNGLYSCTKNKFHLNKPHTFRCIFCDILLYEIKSAFVYTGQFVNGRILSVFVIRQHTMLFVLLHNSYKVSV